MSSTNVNMNKLDPNWTSSLIVVALVQPWIIAYILILLLLKRYRGAQEQNKPPVGVQIGSSSGRPGTPGMRRSFVPGMAGQLGMAGQPGMKQPLLTEGDLEMENPNKAMLKVVLSESGKTYRMEIGWVAWQYLNEALLSAEWNTELTVTCSQTDDRWLVHGLMLRRELRRLSLRGYAMQDSSESLYDICIESDFGDIVRKADNVFVNKLPKLKSRYSSSPAITVTCSAQPGMTATTKKCILDDCLKDSIDT